MKPVISVLIQRSACIFSIMVICFYLAGCASPPPMIQEPVKRYFEVDTSLDTVWKSSVQALVEKGVIISIIDKENCLIVVEEMLDGGAFQRTTAEKAYFYSGLARVSLLFTDQGEKGTGININSVLQGFTGRYNYYVTSNGALEKDYFLLIQNNLPVRKTYKWLEDSDGKTDAENRGEKKTNVQEESAPKDRQ
jgi:hypothetical protein